MARALQMQPFKGLAERKTDVSLLTTPFSFPWRATRVLQAYQPKGLAKHGDRIAAVPLISLPSPCPCALGLSPSGKAIVPGAPLLLSMERKHGDCAIISRTTTCIPDKVVCISVRNQPNRRVREGSRLSVGASPVLFGGQSVEDTFTPRTTCSADYRSLYLRW